MKAFEFVLIILSLIIGLSLTEAAIGVSYMIQNYKTANFHLPFVAMAITGFLYVLYYYSTLFKLRKVTKWSVPNIGLIFLSGLIFFVLTQIYFPDQNGFDQNYEKYFNENFTIVLMLMLCFTLSYMLELFIVRQVRNWKIYLTVILSSLFIISGLMVSNQTYRSILTIFLLLLQIYNIYWSKLIIKDSEA